MSEIKVNKISPRSGTTVTLGDSGDTFTIPSGATINNQGTATNFGATGSASWNTTVKTGDFTAVAGEGYFVDTTSGEIDVTLPAGSPGAVVAVKDYAKTWNTNNCILISNGSEKIGGSTNNATLTAAGLAVTLIYIDSTQGWLVTDDGNQSVASTNPFIEATGGTITTCSNDKIHTFTGPGTFTVSQAAVSGSNNVVSYVVVAGGGGGGGDVSHGGGGGAGGFREDKSPVTPYTASPLDGAGAITVTATDFPITVGAGGARATSGGVSTFSCISSAGGGAGANPTGSGLTGGSGGGALPPGTSGAAGNTPPVSPPQGNPGGDGNYQAPHYGAGGGGGASAAGGPGTTGAGGAGGNGVATSITGSPVTRGGGGGGSSYEGGGPNPGGTGGGGAGTIGGPAPNAANGVAGTANTGGGGGGGERSVPCAGGKPGGSGIVIIRYKFQ